jgi:catechol 2,3-dioxygenase-like lactoylglutathione lyase family enzyme
MKIHHVALTVSNIKNSIEWYQKIFNAEVLARYTKNESEIAHIKIGDVRLELFEYGANTKTLPDYRKNLLDDLHVVGTKHVCIEVSDLLTLKGELEERGVEFGSEVDTAGFGGQYFFIKDPDGILIELYQA